MRLRSLALPAVLVVASVAFAVQGISLRWSPKEGDAIKYRTEGDLNMGEVKATITGTSVQKVIRVDSDGSYLIQATPLDGKAVFAGTEYPMKGPVTLTSYTAAGDIKEIRGDQPDASGYRMANLTAFHAPSKTIAIGDSWTFEGKSDPKSGAIAWKSEYKLVAEEAVAAFPGYKIEITAKETEGANPGKVQGIMWVGKDGVLSKTDLAWSGLSVPGATAPVTGKLVMTRIE